MAKKRKTGTGNIRVDTLRDVAAEIDRELAAPEVLTPERIAIAYARHFDDNEDARIVLEDLKAKFNGTTVRLRPNGIDPYETHFREGQRYLYAYLVERKSPPPKPQQEEREE